MQEDRGSNCGCNNGGLFGNMLCGCGDSEILFFIIIFLLLFQNTYLKKIPIYHIYILPLFKCLNRGKILVKKR